MINIAPALVSMNLASKEVAKSFPSDHKKTVKNLFCGPNQFCCTYLCLIFFVTKFYLFIS